MKTRNDALKMVIAERERQDKKWGYPQNNTPFEWLSILTEEVGESAQALNDALLSANKKDLSRVIEEMVQVAAVAVSIVEHLG